MKKSLAILLVLAMLMTALTGCGGSGSDSSQSGDTKEPFKVGAIYPLSGANALLGSQCLAAVKIAVDFVNAKGGVQGRQVELVQADAPDLRLPPQKRADWLISREYRLSSDRWQAEIRLQLPG
jgi:branched-chain amino acid transport system substrate-binding protein